MLIHYLQDGGSVWVVLMKVIFSKYIPERSVLDPICSGAAKSPFKSGPNNALSSTSSHPRDQGHRSNVMRFIHFYQAVTGGICVTPNIILVYFETDTENDPMVSSSLPLVHYNPIFLTDTRLLQNSQKRDVLRHNWLQATLQHLRGTSRILSRHTSGVW